MRPENMFKFESNIFKLLFRSPGNHSRVVWHVFRACGNGYISRNISKLKFPTELLEGFKSTKIIFTLPIFVQLMLQLYTV